MNVFDLMASLSLDDSEYNSGLDGAKSKGVSVASKIGKGMATAGKAVAAIGTAAAGVGAAFVSQATDVADFGDRVDKLSQKIGMSKDSFQEWDYVMALNGASIDSLQPSMKTLAMAASTNSDAFSELGISQSELQDLSPEELFERTITSLQDMGESTERTAIASKLLGRGATELAPLLNSTAEATEAAKKQAHDYGFVMSEEAVAASAAYEDSLEKLNRTLGGVKNAMVGELLPATTEVMDGLAMMLTTDPEQGAEQVKLGITNMVNKINELLPRVMEVGGTIFESLATAIISSLPQLSITAIDIITSLVTFLVENLPQIVDSGIQILLNLIDGIVEAIPQLIEMLPDIITTIVTTLMEHLPEIIAAAFDIMIALISGLILAIPQLIESIPQIITAIVEGLGAAVEQVKEVGKNIITGLWDGLKEKWTDVEEWFNNKIESLVSGIKKVLGIDIGETGETVKSNVYSMQDVLDMSQKDTGAFQRGMGSMNRNIQNTNQNVSLNLDGRIVAHVQIPHNQREENLVGSSFVN